MKFAQFVARRYLLAKRKQAFIGVISAITLVGITLGVAALNIALAIHNGTRDAFMQSLIGDTGSLNIIANQWYTGDLSDQEARLQKYGFNPADLMSISTRVTALDGVAANTMMRNDSGVLITRGGGLRFARLKSVEIDSFVRTSDRLATLESGSLDALRVTTPGLRPGVLLGSDLAKNAGLRVGDEVQLAVPRLSSPGLSRRGMDLRRMRVRVAGIFRTGNSQFDATDVYMTLESGFKLMSTTRINTVLVKFQSVEAMDAAKQPLIAAMPMAASVVDFRDLNAGLLAALNLEKAASSVVISLFILIVGLNMVSALTMMVMEKHRDIGVMKSFGTPNRVIRGIFIRQGMTLAVVGTGLGTLVGVAVSYVFDRYQVIKLDNAVYEVLSYLPFHINGLEVLLVAAGSLVLSWLTTLYPAHQAATMDPVEALKYD